MDKNLMSPHDIIRCKWCKNDPFYIKYHDTEWGVPVFNDKKIFEALLLEIFQAGLSWSTILNKRKELAIVLNNFSYTEISKYSDKKLDELLLDNRIIRNKLKITAARKNAIAFLNIQKEFGSFSNYIWSFTSYKAIQNKFIASHQLPSSTALSKKISIDLKNRGFQFIGPTIIYSFMQAIGMVNDHTTDCFRYKEIVTSNT